MLEEVSDLRFQQLWQVVHIFDVIVFFAQLGVRYRNQFRIFTGFVGHFQYANRAEKKKKTKQKEVAQSRKERAHELISIGALTEVVKFEKDRGLIAGALLDVLDRINTNEQVKWDLKKRGDDLLHQIELENKAKKEQRQSIKTKISETASKIKDEVKE